MSFHLVFLPGFSILYAICRCSIKSLFFSPSHYLVLLHLLFCLFADRFYMRESTRVFVYVGFFLCASNFVTDLNGQNGYKSDKNGRTTLFTRMRNKEIKRTLCLFTKTSKFSVDL